MSALYFGTGLASPKYGASRGLPFEYLDFFCSAFELAQQNGCERVIQELTDSYEIPAPAPAAEVQMQIDLQRRLVNQLAQSLGVADRFELILASEFRNDPEYLECLSETRANAQRNGIDVPSDYVLLQSAGVDYFRRTRGVTAKMGWLLDPENPTDGRWDEFFFNTRYQEISGDEEFPFIYMKAALDPTGSRCSPYLMRPADIETGRVAIDANYDCSQIPAFADGNKGAKKYYAALEDTVAKLERLRDQGVFDCDLPWNPDTPLEEKIGNIIGDLFGAAAPVPQMRVAANGNAPAPAMAVLP